jgi:glycosyltransferase involved in cell wall biosynthesis
MTAPYKKKIAVSPIYFSIIMPFFNRAEILSRAIDSCLTQTLREFELIMINDSSTDDSLEVALSYSDPRIKIFSNPQNIGPCPSRNLGIKNSTGKWVVMVDSDFSLMPDALERLHYLTLNVSNAVGNLATSCKWDDGQISPDIPSGRSELDFDEYLKWLEVGGVTEKLECIRREVFLDFLYPNSKAWEFEFHMRLASRWRIVIDPTICVNVYTDASNRITKSSGLSAALKVIDEAPDKYRSFQHILDDFGTQIRNTSPKTYEYLVKLATVQLFLCGYRLSASKLIIRRYFQNPLRMNLLPILAVGMFFPRLLIARIVVERRKFFAK